MLYSKDVESFSFGFRCTSANQFWKINIPHSPVNRDTTVHRTGRISISHQQLRQRAGLYHGVVEAANSSILDRAVWKETRKKKMKANFCGKK